jgi:hypothetical protein
MKKYLIITVLICSLLFPLTVNAGLLTVQSVWEKAKQIGWYSLGNPLFSDSTNVIFPLIKDAMAWVEGYSDGAEFLHKLSITDSTTIYEYSLGTSIGLWITDVKAVRRKSTSNIPALSSVSISNRNKINTANDYPDYYATDLNKIWFNSLPAAQCTIYVWYNGSFSPSWSVTSIYWAAHVPISVYFQDCFTLKTVALARHKEGNMVAEANINQIANSMMADVLGLLDLIEKQKNDINILPSVYEQ